MLNFAYNVTIFIQQYYIPDIDEVDFTVHPETLFSIVKPQNASILRCNVSRTRKVNWISTKVKWKREIYMHHCNCRVQTINIQSFVHLHVASLHSFATVNNALGQVLNSFITKLKNQFTRYSGT